MDPQETRQKHRVSANDGDQAQAKEPSGPRGDDPSTAGPGETKVQSTTPENNAGHLNPSAPEDANVTPGSVSKK